MGWSIKREDGRDDRTTVTRWGGACAFYAVLIMVQTSKAGHKKLCVCVVSARFVFARSSEW
jgi:hypothetical protein